MAITGSAYGYVGGDPLNGVDPSGLFCVGTDWFGHACTSQYDTIHTYHPRWTNGTDEWNPSDSIPLRYGTSKFGYNHISAKHGGPYWDALRQTLDHPVGIYPQDGDFSTANRFVFTRCFHNPFDSSDIATYNVVVDFTKVHSHTLGVITAYWDGYWGSDAPWWADFYAL